MKAKYLNPFTDFGFKKIFGEEASKPLLIDFLNALLPPHRQVAQLSFKNAEQLGRTDADRKAIYDIFCENERGEKFIVELQKAKQNYFKERTVFYATFPIQEQAERGGWDFNLKAVYCIGILDFRFDDYRTEAEKHEVLHTIQLKNQHGRPFYDKLTTSTSKCRISPWPKINSKPGSTSGSTPSSTSKIFSPSPPFSTTACSPKPSKKPKSPTSPPRKWTATKTASKCTAT